ncbi:bumetanide-sensitive sodium-(potassium)-chloride cotransporter-like isoform X2 [Rhodnius prolixus]|uniref:bumetanide-sensitive sodium-(potassium)-chloride cotransporter-like isoform X2 n=1 Tax=Rhodnius prolixus TaxID=13249 RepID=UPI003D189855
MENTGDGVGIGSGGGSVSVKLEVPEEEVPMTRFKVARVSITDSTSVRSSLLTPGDVALDGGGTYESSRSLGQLTREVLPSVENYRDIISARHALRPTLEELHEAQFIDIIEKTGRRKSIHPLKKGKIIKFGWLEGVYMRCLLNIWGVMLFLRLSWVIGQAGIVEGIIVICLSNLVTLATTLSMSAVSTNGIIEGGGVYYMISRSLGPEFGGAIGLMFTIANSVAVSMYIVGFCESLQDLVRSFGGTILDNGTNDIRVVGVVTLVGILVLAFVGMDWVTRTQMCLLMVLIASQIDFVIGSLIGPKTALEEAKGFVGYNADVFKENLNSNYRYFEGVEHDFFSVFSVFFPAVTGIVAGANLSGDLKDPSVAIPKGTLLAIITTFLSYISYAFMMGGCVLRDASGNASLLHNMSFHETPIPERWDDLKECNNTCRYGLQNDNQVMELVSLWGPLIYGGCFAATLSSAIASLVGAPRVLQALAKDKLYPFIGFFSKGYGANNDPIRGYVCVFVIAFGCILIGQLNYIAPLLSNFFLAAYALINFSVFHVSLSKSPGWRPSFKYYNAWVSLLGTLLCIAVMFLISWWTALATFFVVVTLYLYVSYRKPEVNWGSSTQAQAYYFALRSALELNKVQEHVKNYRPQLLVLSGMPGYRPALTDFANLITKGKSLLLCAMFIKGTHSRRIHEVISLKAYKWFEQHKVKAFFILGEDKGAGEEYVAKSLMTLSGLGKLKPNTMLMGYKNDWQTCPKSELDAYFSLIHAAMDSFLAVGILRMKDGLDYSDLIEDPDSIVIPALLKKEEEVNLMRNVSGGQLSLGTPGLGQSEEEEEIEEEEEVEEEEEDSTSVKEEDMFRGIKGEPLSTHHLHAITNFRRRQPKGFIDVWWLYDDGGLTLLIPHILSTRSHFSDCKLRIFSLANRSDELDRAHRNLAALLSKFRIDYSDLIIIPNITKKAKPETQKEFDEIIKNFRKEPTTNKGHVEHNYISDSELKTLEEKTNRHMRLRELLKEYSKDSVFIVITLPMPRKGTVSAPHYMAWLELITAGMPPALVLRGNQTSVLTYYS